MIGRLITRILLSSPLQFVLVAFSSLVAALTVASSTAFLAQVAEEYLADAEGSTAGQVSAAVYKLGIEIVALSSHQLAAASDFAYSLPEPCHSLNSSEQQRAVRVVHDSSWAQGDPVAAAIVNADGDTLWEWTRAGADSALQLTGRTDWGELSIVQDAIDSGTPYAATEILPASLAAQTFQWELETDNEDRVAGLESLPNLSALALIGVHPTTDEDGHVRGAAVAAQFLYSGSTLLALMSDVAGLQTVTILVNDIQPEIITDDQGTSWTIGSPLPQSVRQALVEQNRPNAKFTGDSGRQLIYHRSLLLDHLGRPVGGLFTGISDSTYVGMVKVLNERIVYIALALGALAALVAAPIARAITRPVAELLDAHQELAAGDMTVRVQASGRGELATLGKSFNWMVETLHSTQQRLLHSERLASMGQLAAGVAHEINNPLSSILLLSEAVLRETESDDPHEQDLRIILEETKRCRDIVAGLLNFARRQDPLLKETDIHTVLEQVIQTASRQQGFVGVEITRDFEDHLPLIQADPEQLHQVFINLLQNSAEAMPDGGGITVATKSANDNWVTISITDTGQGIPEENLERLFVPFFTTKPAGRGTGLGLAIVYGIIKAHRGRITVQSKAGEGTTFTIELPVCLPEEAPPKNSIHRERAIG